MKLLEGASLLDKCSPSHFKSEKSVSHDMDCVLRYCGLADCLTACPVLARSLSVAMAWGRASKAFAVYNTP